MKSGYSAVDRFLHRLALGNLTLQKSLADIESHTYASLLKQVSDDCPVFITSLPRAGTTLLLELLNETGVFAAHTYRDMPFVLCPLLWNSCTRGFRVKAERQERAHGDGVRVGYDSPEAFDEVLWKAFWPQKYRANHILLWSRDDRDPEFEQAFTDHMRKVIAVRGGGGRDLRYLSKNNANIARLPLLSALFPDCTILIPFRHPVDHASSLARQHRNFLERHAHDAFTQTYMEWIGHYEFGRALRPIAFPGDDMEPACDAEFWLNYWDRAFRHVLEHAPDQAVFVNYDRLCENPDDGLDRLSEALQLPHRNFQNKTDHFHRPNHYDGMADLAADTCVEETHAMLRDRSIN